jgi:hypothetical protein
MNNRHVLALGAGGPLSAIMGDDDDDDDDDEARAGGGGRDGACAEEARASDRGERLGASADLMRASESSARLGGTRAPERGVDADYHYVCFVQGAADGELYELDGTKPSPISHGPVRDSLLADAARVIREQFVAVQPDGHFNVLALVADDDGALAAARDAD